MRSLSPTPTKHWSRPTELGFYPEQPQSPFPAQHEPCPSYPGHAASSSPFLALAMPTPPCRYPNKLRLYSAV